tara:strand:+ start:2476 stop:2805 length:330 start_codon:yes stop_codon:yes gene_type:complete
MFGLLLLLMTLISSFGGAIRFEENFYNEVFDLVDDEKVEVVEGNDEKDLATNSMELEGVDESIPTEAPVPAPVPEPKSKLEVKEESSEIAAKEEFSEIAAYDSQQFASF